jgi:hypothetical protein
VKTDTISKTFNKSTRAWPDEIRRLLQDQPYSSSTPPNHWQQFWVVPILFYSYDHNVIIRPLNTANCSNNPKISAYTLYSNFRNRGNNYIKRNFLVIICGSQLTHGHFSWLLKPDRSRIVSNNRDATCNVIINLTIGYIYIYMICIQCYEVKHWISLYMQKASATCYVQAIEILRLSFCITWSFMTCTLCQVKL